jgi:hypothetical protein
VVQAFGLRGASLLLAKKLLAGSPNNQHDCSTRYPFLKHRRDRPSPIVVFVL